MPLFALRLLSLATLASACGGPVRPAVMPNMQNLPTDPERRSQQLEASTATPGAESRKSLSPGEKTAETAAATAAAILGALFSSKVPGSDEPAFFFGVASPSDELELVDPAARARTKAATRARETKPGNAAEEEAGAEGEEEPLVPWIRIRPQESP